MASGQDPVVSFGPREILECRCDCNRRVPLAVRKIIHTRFHSLSTSEQTVFLRGAVKPKTTRPRKRLRSRAVRCVFEYKLDARGVTYKVCQSAFLSILDIKRTRLRRKVTTSNSRDEPSRDMRGLHLNRPHRTPSEMRERIVEWVNSLPSRESHYSRTTEVTRKYLNPDLTLVKIHQMFSEQFETVPVTYKTFKKIVNADCEVRFGSVRSDICERCEKFHVALAAARRKNDEITIKKLEEEKEDHLSQAQAFYDRLSSYDESPDPATLAICMDFEKNLPLPVTNVGPEYYKRQLWLHNFGIVNVQTNDAYMYVYSEHYAGKGPNEVISMLHHYIGLEKPADCHKLHIFCDNCFSQNKNQFLFVFLDNLCARGMFEEILVTYPIPGHSYMPVDRAFALIEKKKLKTQSLAGPEDWLEIIKGARRVKPFKICNVNFPLSSDMQNVPVVDIVTVLDYKSVCGAKAKRTPIAKIRSVLFRKDGRPTFQTTVGGSWETMELLKRGQDRYSQLSPRAVASGLLPIKGAKKRDLDELLQYVDEHIRFSTFFRSIRAADDADDEPLDEYEA